MTSSENEAGRRRPIPRGLSLTAPVIFSYGFRPFFLGSALWAVGAMVVWLATLSGQIDLSREYGAVQWHAHEMIFGYASAVLAGFLLTAVPNWTGRLPVSGWPLFLLFATWIAGRVGFLVIDQVGMIAAIILDSAFLPVLLLICVQEVVAGRKWRDLKVIGGLGSLSAANVFFHLQVFMSLDPGMPVRLALSAYVAMIMIVGGRMIPSFTRNWLNKQGRTDFPVQYNWFDTFSIVSGVIALAAWTLLEEGLIVASAAGVSAVLHFCRLVRWKGWSTVLEALVLILHVAYLFVPLGFTTTALSAVGVVDRIASIHLMAIGTVTLMMLAVMTRATRGHTGRVLTASPRTIAGYAALIACAVVRPVAYLLPSIQSSIYLGAGILWIAAFGLFIYEYAPMLAKVRRRPLKEEG